MSTVKELLGRGLFYWWSRPGMVRRLVRRMNLKPSQNLRFIDPAALTLGAVQMELTLADSARRYVEMVAVPAAEAARRGAQLIAFPEDAATPLLGLIPGMTEMAREPMGEALAAMGDGLRPADVFRLAGPLVRRIYTAAFSELARRLGVYIHGGSALLPRGDGSVYNTAYLFGPDGRILASGDKTHLLPMEADWGLEPGDELVLADTAIGRVGIPVCMDATYWETFRIMYLQGADLAVLPTANPEEYDEWRVLRGLWARLQESPMFGVQSCLVGEAFGLKLTGRSGIFGPWPLAPGGDGIWARVDDPEREGIAVATVNLAELHDYRREIGIDRSFNYLLYERFFPHGYFHLEKRRARRRRAARGGDRHRSRRGRGTGHGQRRR